MIVAFALGAAFSLIAQYARLNTFDKIASAILLRDREVLQILLSAIAVSSVVFFVEHALGLAPLSIKPLNGVGVVLGAVVFGVGVAILGYCPGTLPMAVAEGNVDAISGCLGGLSAGAAYTLLFPAIEPFLGPHWGPIRLAARGDVLSGTVVLVYAGSLLGFAAYWRRKAAR